MTSTCKVSPKLVLKTCRGLPSSVSRMISMPSGVGLRRTPVTCAMLEAHVGPATNADTIPASPRLLNNSCDLVITLESIINGTSDVWFALLTQHDLWQRCCSSLAPETDLRKIRPSCGAQFDRILPSLGALSGNAGGA